MTKILGPLGINYVWLYNTVLDQNIPLALCLYAVWAIFLIYLLGNTADVYFTPSLAAVCHSLKLSYDIAGVTFLAFGNGAPDVFSSIAAISGGGDGGVLIGLGALLGATVFTLTVIVGSVSSMGQAHAFPLAYGRDMLFHALGTGLVAYCGLKRRITLWNSLSFLVLYGLYVAAAVAIDCYQKHVARKRALSPLSLNQSEDENELVDSAEIAMSAFWHSPSEVYEMLVQSSELVNARNLPAQLQTCAAAAAAAAAASPEVCATPELEFAHEIILDYFGTKSGQVHSHLLGQPLLGSFDGSPSSNFLASKVTAKFWSSSAFHSWKMKRRLQRVLSFRAGMEGGESFSQLPMLKKGFMFVMWPLVLARNLTIPTVESEWWSRRIVSCQLVLSPIFLAFVTRLLRMRVFWVVPVWALVLVVTIPLAVAVYFRTHRSRMPSSQLYTALSVGGSFVLCIAWIYCIASETVAAFEAIGWVTGIPTNLLALTFLAWGNSIGDWVTNLSVARTGFAHMALAGCYGGPLFNLLVGFGIPLTIQNIVQYPQPVNITLDFTTSVTIVYLFAALLFSLVAMQFKAFVYTKMMGGGLCFLYLAYSVTSVVGLIVKNIK